MTPERITELRANTAELGITADDGHIMCDGETWLAVLTAAESAAKLRDAVERSLEMLHPASHSQLHEIRIVLRAAIDAAMKGGEA